MQSKERILRAMRGEEVDRVPFCPFLTYWWESQPDEFTSKGELNFLESIECDPLFRGHWPMTANNYEDMCICKSIIKDCEIKTEFVNDKYKKVTYETTRGNLVLGYRYAEVSDSWFLTEYPVVEEEDFELLRYITENTTLVPNYERYDQVAAELGDRGLLLPLIHPEGKTAFQKMVEHWCGTENLIYALMDFPDTVRKTVDALVNLSMEAARIAAASNAEAFISWEDTSTTNISPELYREWILPEINGWCDILHASGKIYVQHACGHLKALLKDIGNSKIDVLESVTPIPIGDIEMQDVVDTLPEHIAVLGGLGAIQFLEHTEDQVEEDGRTLVKVMKGKRFLLANSDSCPPGISIEKFKRLAKVVRE